MTVDFTHIRLVMSILCVDELYCSKNDLEVAKLAKIVLEGPSVFSHMIMVQASKNFPYTHDFLSKPFVLLFMQLARLLKAVSPVTLPS